MPRCDSCGLMKSITIKCGKCYRMICKADFHMGHGICADCMTLEYAEQYDRYNQQDLFYEEIKCHVG